MANGNPFIQLPVSLLIVTVIKLDLFIRKSTFQNEHMF